MNVMLVTEACLALPGEMSLLWCLWRRVSETLEVRRLLLSSLTITARWDYPGNSSPHHQFISLVNIQSLFSFSSAIEQAEALMKHAYMLEPANPHTLLTYIHTLEVRISLHSTAPVSNKFLSTLHTLMCCFSVTI